MYSAVTLLVRAEVRGGPAGQLPGVPTYKVR